MTRMKWGLAVVGLTMAALATAPPANAADCGQTALKAPIALGASYVPQTITQAQQGHAAINGTVLAKDDPAAKVDKAVLAKDMVGHGVVNISAKNSKVDIGAGGSEVAANASEGAWPLTAGPTNAAIGHIAGTTSS